MADLDATTVKMEIAALRLLLMIAAELDDKHYKVLTRLVADEARRLRLPVEWRAAKKTAGNARASPAST